MGFKRASLEAYSNQATFYNSKRARDLALAHCTSYITNISLLVVMVLRVSIVVEYKIRYLSHRYRTLYSLSFFFFFPFLWWFFPGPKEDQASVLLHTKDAFTLPPVSLGVSSPNSKSFLSFPCSLRLSSSDTLRLYREKRKKKKKMPATKGWRLFSDRWMKVVWEGV